MDSQEKSLEQTMENEKNVEVTPNEATAQKEQVETTDNAAEAENASGQRKVYKTKAEVVERIKEIAHAEEIPQKDEVDYLKTVFYKLHFAEREADMKAYLDAGGDPAAYQVKPDENENAFKAEMTIIKERRAKQFEEQEKLKQDNLKKKLDIIEKIKNMATSPEEANKSYQEFKQLQQEWKEIKMVPAENANELWRNYQLYVEQFYDLLKLNSEAREYDFKKNLEIKTKLCEAAEKLADEDDVISAFHQLQELHQEYRESGPVAKELREGIWARFKAASTVVNRMHSQYFDNLKKQEEENLAKKTAICERIESLDYSKLRGFSEWDRQSREIIAWQQEWRGIGRASRKTNNKIYERFRNACDKFFTSKSEYFKNQKRIFSDVADKKLQLCIQAEELKDSTDWSETTSKIIQLQNEWKELGFLPQKQSQKLWVRFNTACNYFFEQKKQVLGEQMKDEKANLAAKRDILKKLQEIAENITEESTEQVRALMEEWNSVGHVPFRDKDKINNQYRQLIDRLRLDLDLGSSRKGGKAKYHSGGADNAKGGARGNFLLRQYEAKKSELTTYENNITFLTAHSKSGNALIETMNKKIESLKEELAAIVERIKAQEQAAAEEAATETGPETQE